MEEKQKKVPAKRVDVVQVKLVREKTMLYKGRKVRSPRDAYELIRNFLGDVDREHFIVLCWDTKNQPTCIQTDHIGSLNASIVHAREVLKPAILSNEASILIAHNHPKIVHQVHKQTIKQSLIYKFPSGTITLDFEEIIE